MLTGKNKARTVICDPRAIYSAEALAILMNAGDAAPALQAENERLRDELDNCLDFLIATFGQISDPDNPQGWSDDDVFRIYKRIRAALAQTEEQS